MPAEPAFGATCRYVPGPGGAVISAGFWMLSDVDPSDGWISAVWDSLSLLDLDTAEEQCTSLPERLVGTSVAIALVQPSGLRLHLVGGATIEVTTEDDSQAITCPTFLGAISAEVPWPVRSLRLMLGEVEDLGEPMPIGSGVVPATSLILSWPEQDERGELASGSSASSEAQQSPPKDIFEETQIEPTFQADIATPDRQAGPVIVDLGATSSPIPDPALGEGPQDSSTPDPGSGSDSSEKDFTIGTGGSTGATSAAETGPADVSTEGPVVDYDFLFGSTIHRSVVDAMVHEIDGDGNPPAPPNDTPADQAERPGPALTPPPEATPVPPSTPSGPIIKAKGSGIIDSVPWVSRAGQGSAVPPQIAVSEPDAAQEWEPHDDAGLTVSRSKLDALRKSEESSQGSGPTVHAVRCPAGHSNPPHASRCRVCGAEVTEQTPLTMPRPVLGRLRFSTGDDIVLDRDVIIGRQPSTERSGGEHRPHLVRLESPDQDISRNHVRVELNDWHVLVTDLGSTNGTIVLRPGRPAERLRPDEALMIEPGTSVEIAEVVTFAYEVTE